jgi:hypothetical protein
MVVIRVYGTVAKTGGDLVLELTQIPTPLFFFPSLHLTGEHET